MKRRWAIAPLVLVLVALGAVEGLRALQWARRPVEARLVESAVRDVRRVQDPATRAMVEAHAAKLYVRWDPRQARAWAREALETFPAPRGSRHHAEVGDPFMREVRQSVADFTRLAILMDAVTVSPRLVLRHLGIVKDGSMRQDVITAVAMAAAQTDPDLAHSLTESVRDPGSRALIELRLWASHSRRFSKAAVWGEFEPLLTPIERTRDPEARARSLALAGLLARKLGHPEVWERRLRPEFRAALDSDKDRLGPEMVARACLELVAKDDPVLGAEVIAEARRALLPRHLPPLARESELAELLAYVRPREAVRLAAKLPPGLVRAISLTTVTMRMPAGHEQAAAEACDLLEKDLQRPLRPPGVLTLVLEQLACFRPSEAIALARGKKVDVSRVMLTAALRQPDWVLAHVQLLPKPEDRANAILNAVGARLDRQKHSAVERERPA